MRRVRDAALSLVLRALSAPREQWVLLAPLVLQVARVQRETRALAVVLERLDQAALPVLWDLLERLDRMGLLDPAGYRDHRAQLVRADFRVLQVPLDLPEHPASKDPQEHPDPPEPPPPSLP